MHAALDITLAAVSISENMDCENRKWASFSKLEIATKREVSLGWNLTLNTYPGQREKPSAHFVVHRSYFLCVSPCLFPIRSFAAGTLPLSTRASAMPPFIYKIYKIVGMRCCFGSNINGSASFICDPNEWWKTRLKPTAIFIPVLCATTQWNGIVFMHVLSIHQSEAHENTRRRLPNAGESKRARVLPRILHFDQSIDSGSNVHTNTWESACDEKTFHSLLHKSSIPKLAWSLLYCALLDR